jgi:hypothetical protein
MTDVAGVKMVDMKRPKESLSPKNVGKISPDPYSYDHRISLDQDALDKLGVAGTPKVGDVFHVLGQGHVHSVDMQDSDGGGKSLRVGIQLRKLGVKPKAAGTPAPKGATPKGALDAVSKGVSEADEA